MNKTYEAYQSYKISDVPLENLKIIVTGFINDSALTLGCNATKADVDKVSELMASNQFNFLPVNVASSAFTRGSLGKLKNDKTTLSPRNIYDWLSEVSLEYRNHIEHNERDYKLSNPEGHFNDLMNCPFGKAIMKKIDWELTEDEWDKVPLKMLAEIIGRNERVTMADFGIIR